VRQAALKAFFFNPAQKCLLWYIFSRTQQSTEGRGFTQHNDTQHNNKQHWLSSAYSLTVAVFNCHAECLHAEHRGGTGSSRYVMLAHYKTCEVKAAVRQDFNAVITLASWGQFHQHFQCQSRAAFSQIFFDAFKG
jgi:hypothetical protein